MKLLNNEGLLVVDPPANRQYGVANLAVFDAGDHFFLKNILFKKNFFPVVAQEIPVTHTVFDAPAKIIESAVQVILVNSNKLGFVVTGVDSVATLTKDQFGPAFHFGVEIKKQPHFLLEADGDWDAFFNNTFDKWMQHD